VPKFRKARIRAEHEPAAVEPGKHAGTDPLDEVHVGVPRWRAPLSATPDETAEAASEDAEDAAEDEDDTLEFDRPRPII
jgi:hypothetical protein